MASSLHWALFVGTHCYATQIFKTGLLHADPHAGNLIVTPDGRLAILDFGQVIEARGLLRNCTRTTSNLLFLLRASFFSTSVHPDGTSCSDIGSSIRFQ